MPRKKLTVSHYVPLIGAFEVARQKLNAEGYNLDLQDIVSFSAFGNNEQHIYHNYPELSTKKINIDDLLDEVNYDAVMTKHLDWAKQNKIRKSNMVLAVPPCAGLSMLNSCRDPESPKARGCDAIQMNWVYGLVKYYLATDSDVLVFENAPGLIGPHGLPVIERINNIIKANGYDRKVQLVKTTTINHGIPQDRKRSFLFIHKGKNFQRLANKFHKFVPVEDYLKSFPKIKDDPMSFAIKGKGNDNWLRLLNDHPEILKLVREKYQGNDKYCIAVLSDQIDYFVKNQKQFASYEGPYREISHAVKKLEMDMGFWDASPLVIKGKINALISKSLFRIMDPNNEKQYITFRDSMRLMGLPDSFEVVDVKRNMGNICQSVPVCTAADAIKWGTEFLEGSSDGVTDWAIDELKTKDFDFIIQNNYNGDLENDVFYLTKGNKKNQIKS